MRDSFLRRLRLYERVIDGYLSQRYGYHVGIKGMINQLLGILLYLHPGRRADADVRVMCLPAKSAGRLLEVGFGSGQTLKRLQELGWNVHGVDSDPAAVKNASFKGLNVRFGDLAARGYPDNYCFAL